MKTLIVGLMWLGACDLGKDDTSGGEPSVFGGACGDELTCAENEICQTTIGGLKETPPSYDCVVVPAECTECDCACDYECGVSEEGRATCTLYAP